MDKNMSNEEIFDKIFGDFFGQYKALTPEQQKKEREEKRRKDEQREKEKELARKKCEEQLEIYLAKKVDFSLIYNIDFIDSDTFKSILTNIAEVCVRRQYELDKIFLLSVMNTALNTKKIEPFHNINEMLNFYGGSIYKTPSVEEKKSVYEYIRCCLQEKIKRYPEMKKNAILIMEILLYIEKIDNLFENINFSNCNNSKR